MSDLSNTRKVRFGDLEFDHLSLHRIMQLIEEYGVDGTGEFLSERNREWKLMAGIMNDFSPYLDERLASAISAGIQWVRVLDSGYPGDCAARKSLSGKRYPIAQAPQLPPLDCICLPWCRCDIASAK